MKRLCMGCMQEYDAKYDVCPFCGYIVGTPPKEAYHMTPGTILNNKYIIGRVLGFGGFGITYIAYDKILEQRVAIKEYMPGEFSTRMPEQKTVTVFSGDREEQFKEGLLKIEEEAKRLSKFSSVPNIVHIFDCFQANGTVYIVMEYLDGESLKDKLAREGKMPVQDAYDIIIKVIEAMKKVHKEGIIHRDIAPDNIFILKNGEVKVIDFGAARYATTKHSKSLSVIIKPGYAPEEQYRSRGDQGPHTDVYALAATFYKMITGITPEDAMERSVKDMLKHPSKLGVEISKPMDTAIMNALMVNIADRTPTMDEFEKELNDAEVKERKKTAAKDTSGNMPMPLKVCIGVGTGIITLALLAVLTTNVAPRLGIDKILGATEVTVPNFINQDYDSIKDSDNLSIITDEVNYNDEYIEGRVIKQDVEAGATVPKETEIKVVVSAGSRPMLIPNLIGMRIDEAEVIAKKLYKNVLAEPSNEDMASVPPGVVVYQSQTPYSDTIRTGYGDSITIRYNADGFDESTYIASDEATDVPDNMDVKSQALSDVQNDYYNNYDIYLSPIYVIKDIINNKYIRVDEYNDEVQDYMEVNINVPDNISSGTIIEEHTGEKADNKGQLLHVYVYDGIKPFATDNYKGRDAVEIQSLLISAGVNASIQYEFDSYVKTNGIIRLMSNDGVELTVGSILHSGDNVILIVNNGIDPNKPFIETTKAKVETTAALPETTKAKAGTTAATLETTVRETQPSRTQHQKQPQTQPQTTAAPPSETVAEIIEQPQPSQETEPTAVRPRHIERTQADEEGSTKEGEESTKNKKKGKNKDKKKDKKGDKKKKSNEDLDEDLNEDLDEDIEDDYMTEFDSEEYDIDEDANE